MPVNSYTCTGYIIKLQYTEKKESERIEIQYITQSQFNEIIQLMQEELEKLVEELQELEEFSHWNEERITAAKYKKEQFEKQIELLKEKYAKIKEEFLPKKKSPREGEGNAISESPREGGGDSENKGPEPIIKQVLHIENDQMVMDYLEETTVKYNNEVSRLINSASIYLHHSLLKYVTVYDTPGIREDPLHLRDHSIDTFILDPNLLHGIFHSLSLYPSSSPILSLLSSFPFPLYPSSSPILSLSPLSFILPYPFPIIILSLSPLSFILPSPFLSHPSLPSSLYHFHYNFYLLQPFRHI